VVGVESGGVDPTLHAEQARSTGGVDPTLHAEQARSTGGAGFTLQAADEGQAAGENNGIRKYFQLLILSQRSCYARSEWHGLGAASLDGLDSFNLIL